MHCITLMFKTYCKIYGKYLPINEKRSYGAEQQYRVVPILQQRIHYSPNVKPSLLQIHCNTFQKGESANLLFIHIFFLPDIIVLSITLIQLKNKI